MLFLTQINSNPLLSKLKSIWDVINVSSELKFDKIFLGILLVLITTFYLSLSEKFNSQTRDAYENKMGYGSWVNVRNKSIIWGIGFGLLSAIGGYNWGDKGYLFFYLANLGTVLGYVSGQAIETDFSTNRVDRYLLRLAYIDTFVLTVVYIMNTFSSPIVALTVSIPVITCYIALFFAFFFSSIGASDVRAIIIFLPFLVALNMKITIFSFVAVCIMISVIMYFQKIHKMDLNYRVPILPYLTTPYAIITPFIPLLIDINLILSI